MNAYLALSIAIVSEIAGTTALKAAEGFTKPLPSGVVVIGYGLAFYFFSVTLKTMPIGIAYAIWAGAGIAAITLIGWLRFRQSLDLAAIIGIGLIIAGVVVLNLLSKSTAH